MQHALALNGIDRLGHSDNIAPPESGCAVVTNHTGIDQSGRSLVDIIQTLYPNQLKAIFSPEHGFRGAADEVVADSTDPSTGIPVYSLFGARTKPTAEQLHSVSRIYFDIQDIGTRFYTYISTLGCVMEACAGLGVELVVLDRPNPINGIAVEGPLPDPDKLNFVAFHTLPIRHGLTMGEIASLLQAERFPSCKLTVVPCTGWKRAMWFDQTGQYWTNPSPNMRSQTSALLYPGIAIMEFCNISVGRGTDRPFQLVGAPYIIGNKLSASLNALEMPGVTWTPTRFTPTASKFASEHCEGVDITVTDRNALRPVELGWMLAKTIDHLHAGEFQHELMGKLLLSSAAMDDFNSDDVHRVFSKWREACTQFRSRVTDYLLYP